MKRLPVLRKEETAPSQPGPLTTAGTPRAPKIWRTIDERNGDPAVDEARLREFVEERPFEPPAGVNRRSFLGIMGASMAIGGLAACHRPDEHIIPFAHQPEDTIPGRPEYFATSIPFYGTAIGVVVESNDGRPTKIEGNRLHPESLGGTTAFIQAHILNLYDPDRSDGPEHKESKDKEITDSTIDTVWKAVDELGKKYMAAKGKGLGIIITDHRSHTTQEALDAVLREMPEVHVVKHEAFGREQVLVGNEIAFGERLETVYRVRNADVIVAFDSDFLGTEGSPIRCAKEFSARRRVENGNMNRLYVAEPCPTITSNQADHRLRAQGRRIPVLVRALAGALAKQGVDIPQGFALNDQLTPVEQKWVDAAAKDLASAHPRGGVAPASRAAGLVIVGRRQHPAVHALAAVINDSLQSLGVSYKPEAFGIPNNYQLKRLTDEMSSGAIKALVILGGNPVFTAPSDLKFEDALKNVETSLHLSFHQDDTTKLTTWHIPRAHELESWSDTRAEDGTASIIQPLIAPMHDGKTDAEVLHRLVGGTMNAYELVRAAYSKILLSTARPEEPRPRGAEQPENAPVDGAAHAETSPLDKAWRRALFDGVVPMSANADKVSPLNKDKVLQALGQIAKVEGDVEVVFAPDYHAYDGRYRNNGWLQETPDPIHKVTWTNVAAISYATAQKLGVKDGIASILPGDKITVNVGGDEITMPVVVTYGHADDSVTVYVGQGREYTCDVATMSGLEAGYRHPVGVVGVDTRPIRKAESWDIGGGTVKKANGEVTLASTQNHHNMDGRPVIREQTLTEFKNDPSYARELVVPEDEKKELENSWGDAWTYERNDWNKSGHKWGMTIDLSLCTGCSACVTACIAENNIVVVGPAGVAHHREMHWIRIDRYFAESPGEAEKREGDPAAPPEPQATEDDARSLTMPMLCQHCEMAPCEQVCPVAATTHSPEGINEMTYNRCIGTKYCGNNCPFKVRRFNFFNYTKEIPETLKLQLNPDVTVRSRGVMEKCTFCVQRVQEAKIASHKLRRADGSEWPDPAERRVRENEFLRAELVTACQQACPSDAIIFGDLNDEYSAVAKSVGPEKSPNPRGYKMLEELNVRPRITYLGRIRNPNPDLEPPAPSKKPTEKGEEKQ